MVPTIHVFKGPSMEHLWPGYFCQMRSGHCYFTIWLFCQVKFSCLQNCQVHIAQFSSERCQGHIPKSGQCYSALWLFCRIANSDSPCGLTAWMTSRCHRFLIFWAVKGSICFRSAQTLFPDYPCFFVFSTACLVLSHFPLPFLFLDGFFVFLTW